MLGACDPGDIYRTARNISIAENIGSQQNEVKIRDGAGLHKEMQIHGHPRSWSLTFILNAF
jgi:hypothetical protein